MLRGFSHHCASQLANTLNCQLVLEETTERPESKAEMGVMVEMNGVTELSSARAHNDLYGEWTITNAINGRCGDLVNTRDGTRASPTNEQSLLLTKRMLRGAALYRRKRREDTSDTAQADNRAGAGKGKEMSPADGCCRDGWCSKGSLHCWKPAGSQRHVVTDEHGANNQGPAKKSSTASNSPGAGLETVGSSEVASRQG